jgi:hypothetical protein
MRFVLFSMTCLLAVVISNEALHAGPQSQCNPACDTYAASCGGCGSGCGAGSACGSEVAGCGSSDSDAAQNNDRDGSP